MEYKKKMIKIINNVSSRYGVHKVFGDFVRLSAISISNAVDKYNFDKREKEYFRIIKKYRNEDAQAFPELLALLVCWLEEKPTDALGELYMELSINNKHTGQFFTPFNVSTLTAEMLMDDPWKSIINGGGKITLNEPACGGGGMIIAYAMALLKKGVNYQDFLEVTANDLDANAVMMTYVQCSLLGIQAIVYQQNTLLQNPVSREDYWITPLYAIKNNMIDVKKAMCEAV